jgi:hypothetical protein
MRRVRTKREETLNRIGNSRPKMEMFSQKKKDDNDVDGCFRFPSSPSSTLRLVGLFTIHGNRDERRARLCDFFRRFVINDAEKEEDKTSPRGPFRAFSSLFVI